MKSSDMVDSYAPYGSVHEVVGLTGTGEEERKAFHGRLSEWFRARNMGVNASQGFGRLDVVLSLIDAEPALSLEWSEEGSLIVCNLETAKGQAFHRLLALLRKLDVVITQRAEQRQV